MSVQRAPVALNHSRDMLQKMQSRLRNKMKRRGGVSSGREEESGGASKNGGQVDIRVSGVHVADMNVLCTCML